MLLATVRIGIDTRDALQTVLALRKGGINAAGVPNLSITNTRKKLCFSSCANALELWRTVDSYYMDSSAGSTTLAC
jgi:hypothetical protein